MIKFDFKTYNNKYINSDVLNSYNDRIKKIRDKFSTKELSHWLDVNTYITDNELQTIKTISEKIREKCDVFVVIGIGGSYMGSKAIIEAFTPFYAKKKPEIIFFGKNLNSNEYSEVITHIKDKEIAVNVISKSGTTLEPSIAFDIIFDIMKEKYSEAEIKERLIITTDVDSGTLRELAREKDYTSFVIPTIVGGRYSVFTPVGLLPIAVAGIDIDKLLSGVQKANVTQMDNAEEYAIIRDVMYNNGKKVESFTIYDEKLAYLTEWLKQLFAESHGKEGKGVLPIANINTRDLHSMGQYLQEGENIIFETVIGVENNSSLYIEKYHRNLNEINNIALDRVCEAHNNGYTPSSIIWIEKIAEEDIGEIMQFFMISTIIGGYLLEINPFDQPGVQEYKHLINENLN